jgi:uncharacterized RDD family membrane protein YckC
MLLAGRSASGALLGLIRAMAKGLESATRVQWAGGFVVQGPTFSDPAAVEQAKPPTRYFAGFWRRLFALMIDGLLTAVPCFLLGYLFYDFFSRSSGWATATGFAITFPYFAILGSSIGNGQTLGQRWTGIEVVDAQGNHLSLTRSLLRYAILLVPFLFRQATLPSYLAWPLEMAGLAIIYLYLFNTGTRQTLHDLATGSFVVEAPGIGVVEERRPWVGHWVILGALGILGIVATPLLNRTGPFPELLAVQRTLLDSGNFREVGVMLQTINPGSKTGLHLTVTCRMKPANYDTAAKKIVTTVEQVDPRASEMDFISVDFKEGFSVGFATYSATKRVSHTPHEWAEMLQGED